MIKMQRITDRDTIGGAGDSASAAAVATTSWSIASAGASRPCAIASPAARGLIGPCAPGN